MDSSNDLCLHELVERSARRRPDAVAVRTPSRTLTYAELDREADAVARKLLTAGVDPGSPVAVVMRKGWQQVVAVLGILKAGAAYLPIDPEVPASRLRHVAELARTPRALTQPELADRLEWPEGLPVDVIVPGPAGEPSDGRPLPAVSPDSLAYLMFTSGTTGVPKGVMVEHRSAVNTVLDINRRFGIGEDDAVLGLSAITFDLSVYDLFGITGAGGTLVLPDPDRRRDPQHWWELLTEHRVTVWNSVPALAAALASWPADSPDPGRSLLETVLLSGDWLPVDLPEQLRRAFPAARVINLAGMTEAAIWSLFHVVDDADADAVSIPFGRPLAGQGACVLSEDLLPVPDGEPGELCIEGAGLARGYWDDPELTARRFPRHPVSDARLYRTGDQARVLPNGEIEFLGRTDLQVKVHGFRIELGEIEAVAADFPGVVQAAAVALGPTTALERIATFVRVRPGAEVDPEAVRRHVAGRLPVYMVPDDVHVVDAWPLSANGKIDRAALADEATRARLSGSVGEPVRSQAEARIAEIFAEVLGRPVRNRDDDFFDLGGRSLDAVRVTARIRHAFGSDAGIAMLFDNSTVAAAAQAVEAAPVARAEATITRAPRDEAPVLASFGQEQLWYLDRLASGNRAYHFQCGIRFQGVLQPDLLRRAITEVVRRHEILRTVFHEVGGRPVQLVREPDEVPLPLEDLRDVPDEDRERELERRMRGEFGRDFDISQGPLIVWRLFRIADDDWVITETEHHLVHDGWSVAVMWREIQELYSAWVQGRAPDLPDLAIQFGDFSAWQRNQYTGERREQALAHWRERLAGAQPLDLAVAGIRPAKQRFDGSAIRFAVPHELYCELREFADREGVSLYVVMFSAFVLLLHFYSGQDDLCVGTWMANRGDPATEHLIGMLVNMVAIRSDLSDRPDFRELLRRTRSEALAALRYQDTPFDDVVRELKLPRDPSRNPLVQASFSFHDSAVPDFHWPGAVGRMTEYNNGSAKFDLNIVVIPRAEQLGRTGRPEPSDELALLWEYNTDLFDADTAARMTEHYQHLLQAVISDPGAVPTAAMMTSDADRALIAAANATSEPVPDDADLVSRLRIAAAADPARAAVSGADGELSYAELDAASDRLARHLVDLGVRPGDAVGVCLDRGVRLPVALIAVLKAGAAYVPVDHRHPRSRIVYSLHDAGVRLVVTESVLAPMFKGWDTVRVDRLTEDPSGSLPEPGAVAVDQDERPAYVLYTSGTSGRPKGVRVPHRALSNLLRSMAGTVGMTSRDTLVAVTTIAFDIAALEMFLPLYCGGRVVIAPYETTIDGEKLVETLESHGATFLQATPATWRIVLAAGWRPKSRFSVLCGGEALPADLASDLTATGAACWNLYGPTETTIWSTVHRLRGGERVVPIGRPLPNTTAHVLDPDLRPLPVGVPGELWIGGLGAALGYTSAELTAERFARIEVDGRADRLYRTGDVVLRTGDGLLRYLGRNDRQIKVHGYRIEPEEIENVLRTHRDVTDAAVDLRGTPERIVGYVVCDGAAPPDGLAEHVAKRLPRYMVPVDFVALRELPRTVSGKVDHSALPEPGAPTQRRATDPEGEAATEAERLLAVLWAEVLGQDSVGVEDDFFGLGGHSLLALVLVARIRETTGRHVVIETVLDHPTPRSMAAALPARPAVIREAI